MTTPKAETMTPDRIALALQYRATAHVCIRAAKAAKRAKRIEQYLAQRAMVTHCIVKAHQIERAAA